jgi:tetratricopeptide (TPR) repeat protein
MGRTAEARKSIEQAVELSPDNITVLYDAGVTYVTLEEFDRAIDALKRAIDVGYSASFIDTDPLFDNLRGTARYTELIADPSQI